MDEWELAGQNCIVAQSLPCGGLMRQMAISPRGKMPVGLCNCLDALHPKWPMPHSVMGLQVLQETG